MDTNNISVKSMKEQVAQYIADDLEYMALLVMAEDAAEELGLTEDSTVGELYDACKKQM